MLKESATTELAPEDAKPRVSLFGEHLYIRIRSFQEARVGVPLAIEEALRAMPPWWRETTADIILNLRGDPGGLVDYGKRFLEENFSPAAGQRFMEYDGPEPEYARSSKTYGLGKLVGIPVYVLTDGATASVAEWVLFQLKKWDPQHVRHIGTRTFGKSTMHCRSTLWWGIAAQFPCGSWGDGLVELGRGIVPDVDIDLSGCGEDIRCLAMVVESNRH